MTPQEQQLIQQLAQRINQTKLNEKDTEAEALLAKELGGNPDALYILAQTVLVQDITLQQANSHIAQLEQQVEELQQQLDADEQEIGELQQQAQYQQAQQQPKPSFLGRIFGQQPVAPPQGQYQPAPTQYSQPGQGGGYQPVQTPYQPTAPGYQPVQQYAPAQPQYIPAQPQYVPAAPMGGPMVMGGQPSFLQGAMQTAAGVAAGTLAVEGVESLLHGFGHHGYGGGGYGLGGFGGGFGGERPMEEVVNNYYGDDRERERGYGHEGGGFDSGFGEEHGHHEGARFADTGSDSLSGDNFADPGLNRELDDTSSFTDASSYDDSGSFDDGGSNDDNGSF